MSQPIQFSLEIPDSAYGQRLDQALSELLPDYSRARLQGWIKDGSLTVNGQRCKPRDKVMGGEQVALDCELEAQDKFEPEDIPLDVVYEDDHILVINKPAGLVVHPAAGHWQGTLLNALLFHCKDAELIPRAGIVHRLDMETTGLMVVAKTLQAQNHLVEQLQTRQMGREYEAVVQGNLTGGGEVDQPIGRHPRNRLKMAVVANGKEALTHYRVLRRYTGFTHLRLKLETGRTHQIRVHMAHIHHPLVGDPLYTGRSRVPAGISKTLQDTVKAFPRQALHARQLTLIHPETEEQMSWEAPLPEDMQQLLAELQENEPEFGGF